MKTIKTTILLLCLALVLTFSSCKQPVTVKTSDTFIAFDTVMTITLYSQSQAKNKEALEWSKESCYAWEKIFSRTDPESELYQVNHSAEEDLLLSDTLAALVAESMDYATLSKGIFEPTIGAVSSLWDFKQKKTAEPPVLPKEQDIKAALAFVGYQKISLNGTQYRKPEGVMLDFGAIAKGFVGDMLKEHYQEQGIGYGLVDFGGDIIVFGEKEEGTPWKIGIGNPNPEVSGHIATLSLTEGAVVTSGNYQRYFEKDGVRYHHILDPTTGYPVDNNITLVTVWAPTGTAADALSTVCYVLGIEKGIKFMESTGLGHAIYYDNNGNFTTTKGLEGFSIT